MYYIRDLWVNTGPTDIGKSGAGLGDFHEFEAAHGSNGSAVQVNGFWHFIPGPLVIYILQLLVLEKCDGGKNHCTSRIRITTSINSISMII